MIRLSLEFCAALVALGTSVGVLGCQFDIDPLIYFGSGFCLAMAAILMGRQREEP